MSSSSFEGLMFQDIRMVAMRETLRSVGVFLHPKFIETCSNDQKFLDRALLGLFRGVLVALTDDTQDLSIFTIEALNSISTDSIPDFVYSDYMSILDVLHGILSAISAPAFSPTLDQDELGLVAVERLTQLLPNSQFQVHLRYSNLRSTATIPKADQGYDRPLWADEQPSINDPTEWKRTNEPRQISILILLQALSSDWSFWRQWYRSFLDGTPLDWELQRKVALIDEAVWDAGPAAVAEAIHEIEANRAGDLPRPENVPELERFKLIKYVERLLAAPEMTALAAEGAAATLQRAISEYLVKAEVNCLPDELSHLEGMPALFQGLSKIVKSGEQADAKARHLADQIEALNAKVAKLEAALKAARAKTVHSLFKQSAIKAAGAAFGGGVVGTLGVGLAHFFGGWPDDFTLQNLRGFLSDLETATPIDGSAASLLPATDV